MAPDPMQQDPHRQVRRDRAFYDAALRETAARTAGAVGDAYFRTLVRSLAETLDVEVAFVAEFAGSGTRVKQLARWGKGRLLDPVEFDTAITPCRDVIAGRVTHYSERVGEHFPREEGFESYLGVPLFAENDVVVGHLAVLDTAPFEVLPETWTVLQTFAARAAVELTRRRTRDLLESTMTSVMDAIVTVGPERRIDLCNPAAERMLALAPGTGSGRRIREFLSEPLMALLETYTDSVERGGDTATTPLWSPGGLSAVSADGKTFHVDVTVSPTALGGQWFFTLVLRSLEERRAAERALEQLATDKRLLQSKLREREGVLLGDSPPMRELRDQIAQVAPTGATVLVTGETGTGKELIANALHDLSERRDRVLVTLNCAALPRELIESELFGHEKGAFTGATQRKRGRFELADGGTLFLDEVGELSADAQAKLLRVLQEREVERLGGSGSVAVDVRVIAATNRDLARMVTEGSFRSDLYYRLAVFPLHAPPLRDRGEDIVLLARSFLDQFARGLGKTIRDFDADAIDRLRAYDWPGNVRELRNVIERATILARGDRLVIDLGTAHLAAPGATPPGGDESLDEVQRAHIERTLARTGGVIDGPGGAAARLGIHPNTLRSRMTKLGVRRP